MYNIRTKAPKADNSFFYSKKNIFYPKFVDNCTWFAWGSWLENGIDINPKNMSTSNAENWYEETKFEKGNIPKIGAIAVWKAGKRHKASDGMGHVAIVTEILNDGTIITSNSGVKSKYYNKKIKPPYKLSGKEFEGFIYHNLSENKQEEKINKESNSPKYYIVKKGDTLSKIALKYNTTVDNLLKLNPTIKNKNLIYINQRIRIK